jgi:ABC-type dipeptide/oligopeptide/nickel transport system ATPase subunit
MAGGDGRRNEVLALHRLGHPDHRRRIGQDEAVEAQLAAKEVLQQLGSERCRHDLAVGDAGTERAGQLWGSDVPDHDRLHAVFDQFAVDPAVAGFPLVVAEGVVAGDHVLVAAHSAATCRSCSEDPYTSLNPSMTVGDILSEPLTVQGKSRTDARKRVREVLDQVGLPQDTIGRLPREFSGGQRQRVAIARALALSPRLIVCDEPVSALDLTTQARVLDLFLQIQRDTGVAYLFVSHDLDVVRHISHRVAVMYHGEIVEQGPAQQVTAAPEHPYTQRLLLASPVPDPDRQHERRANRRRLIDQQAARKVQAGVPA